MKENQKPTKAAGQSPQRTRLLAWVLVIAGGASFLAFVGGLVLIFQGQAG